MRPLKQCASSSQRTSLCSVPLYRETDCSLGDAISNTCCGPLSLAGLTFRGFPARKGSGDTESTWVQTLLELEPERSKAG